MHDTSITKVNSHYSPKGENGSRVAAGGIQPTAGLSAAQKLNEHVMTCSLAFRQTVGIALAAFIEPFVVNTSYAVARFE